MRRRCRSLTGQRVLVGMVTVAIMLTLGCSRYDDQPDPDLDLSLRMPETGNPRTDGFMAELRETAIARLDDRVDAQASSWCTLRSDVESMLPTADHAAGWWDEPGRDRDAADLIATIAFMEEDFRRPGRTSDTYPETFQARVCALCPGLASEIPASSPRLPPGAPGVWGPDCDADPEDDLVAEMGCQMHVDPVECEVEPACWYRYYDAVGCYELPDLVAWTQEWCGIRREMNAWDAERLSINDEAARQEWLQANQPAFDVLWEREQALYTEHEGFDPTGSYIQPLQCELCPDIQDDC